MSKSEQTLTITGAAASPLRSVQKVLDIERRLIDDCIQVWFLTSISPEFPGSIQRASGFGAGVLAVFEHLFAVNKDVSNTD